VKINIYIYIYIELYYIVPWLPNKLLRTRASTTPSTIALLPWFFLFSLFRGYLSHSGRGRPSLSSTFPLSVVLESCSPAPVFRSGRRGSSSRPPRAARPSLARKSHHSCQRRRGRATRGPVLRCRTGPPARGLGSNAGTRPPARGPQPPARQATRGTTAGVRPRLRRGEHGRRRAASDLVRGSRLPVHRPVPKRPRSHRRSPVPCPRAMPVRREPPNPARFRRPPSLAV
jgi:hypothetical protein